MRILTRKQEHKLAKGLAELLSTIDALKKENHKLKIENASLKVAISKEFNIDFPNTNKGGENSSTGNINVDDILSNF